MTGATGCVQCEEFGTQISPDALECVLCPDGTYPNHNRTSCLTCADGHIGLLGVCTRCPDGTYVNAARNECLECPALQAGREGYCDQCPNGTRVFGDNTVRTDCEVCPSGHVGTGALCEPCGHMEYPNEPDIQFRFRGGEAL
eukprot:SAG22_NODE_11643_length_475_cov_13.138298_1_plen_141_part_01